MNTFAIIGAICLYVLIGMAVGRALYAHWDAERAEGVSKGIWDDYYNDAWGLAFAAGAVWPLVAVCAALWRMSALVTPTVGAARRAKLSKRVQEQQERIEELERELRV